MGETFLFFATLSYLGKQPECLTCRLSFAIVVAKPEVSKKNKDENDGILSRVLSNLFNFLQNYRSKF